MSKFLVISYWRIEAWLVIGYWLLEIKFYWSIFLMAFMIGSRLPSKILAML